MQLDGPEEIRHAAGAYLSADARAVTRVPGGHPEGYLEAFAVLYREFADAFEAWRGGNKNPLPPTLPGIGPACAACASSSAPSKATRRASGSNSNCSGISGVERTGRRKMKTIKGPGIFLAQFAGDAAPFNTLENMARWAAGLGFAGVQIPTWDARLFDLKQAAESQAYCDDSLGGGGAGLRVTELSTHLQGQLVASNPAYDAMLEGFAPAGLDVKARQEWAVQQLQWARHGKPQTGPHGACHFLGRAGVALFLSMAAAACGTHR